MTWLVEEIWTPQLAQLQAHTQAKSSNEQLSCKWMGVLAQGTVHASGFYLYIEAFGHAKRNAEKLRDCSYTNPPPRSRGSDEKSRREGCLLVGISRSSRTPAQGCCTRMVSPSPAQKTTNVHTTESRRRAARRRCCGEPPRP